jgi:hypothetical protein
MSTKAKIIFGVVALILVGGVVFYLLSRKKDNKEVTQTSTNSTTKTEGLAGLDLGGIAGAIAAVM